MVIPAWRAAHSCFSRTVNWSSFGVPTRPRRPSAQQRAPHALETAGYERRGRHGGGFLGGNPRLAWNQVKAVSHVGDRGPVIDIAKPGVSGHRHLHLLPGENF